jgi:hypothetical protein
VSRFHVLRPHTLFRRYRGRLDVYGLDGERISVRITLFGLVVENSVRLVISREM